MEENEDKEGKPIDEGELNRIGDAVVELQIEGSGFYDPSAYAGVGSSVNDGRVVFDMNGYEVIVDNFVGVPLGDPDGDGRFDARINVTVPKEVLLGLPLHAETIKIQIRIINARGVCPSRQSLVCVPAWICSARTEDTPLQSGDFSMYA